LQCGPEIIKYWEPGCVSGPLSGLGREGLAWVSPLDEEGAPSPPLSGF
jgi:hypothetical protein